jgi:AbrB family looped-hinge helix DNA binding protein
MIGRNLQKLRKQKNLTQEALAEMVGVARQTIAKWETEESAPDLETAGRLASVLDVALDDLVNAPTEELDEESGLKGKHMFGLVTVGDKGQIVIPVRARRIFQIKPGDQLMVLGEDGKGLALMDANLFMAVAEEMKNGL